MVVAFLCGFRVFFFLLSLFIFDDFALEFRFFCLRKNYNSLFQGRIFISDLIPSHIEALEKYFKEKEISIFRVVTF